MSEATKGRPAFLQAKKPGGVGGTQYNIVAEVVSVNPETQELICRLPGDARTFAVGVFKKSAERPVQKKAVWEGNHIDERAAERLNPMTVMADGKEQKVHQRIILEHAVVFGKPENGTAAARDALLNEFLNKKNPKLFANWIHAATPNPDKVRQGFVTVAGFKNEVQRVIVWDGAPVTADDKAAMAALAARIAKQNVSLKEGEKRPVKPQVAVTVRAVGENGEIVGVGPVVSYNGEAKRPLNSEDLAAYVGAFKEDFPNAALDVLVGDAYPASQKGVQGLTLKTGEEGTREANSRAMYYLHGLLRDTRDPENGAYTGMIGTHAVVEFSPGKPDPRLPNVMKGAEHDWVTGVFLSRQEDLLTAIPGRDGKPLHMPEYLVREDYQPEPHASEAGEGEDPVPRASGDERKEEDDDDSPFAGLGG